MPKKGKSGIDDNSLAAATTLHYLLLQCIAKFHISYDPSNLCMISQLFSLSSTHLTYAPENVDTSATYRHELSSKVKNLITFILPVFIAPMAFFFFTCVIPQSGGHIQFQFEQVHCSKCNFGKGELSDGKVSFGIDGSVDP